MSMRGFIGLGSNLGDRAANLDAALQFLDSNEFLEVVQTSSYWETRPVGPPQPDYLNAAAEIITSHSPHELLEVIGSVERRLGRVRTPQERNGPRTIDLDILLLGELVVVCNELTIPHPRMMERAFVMVPLVEIDPDLRHPVTGLSLESVLSARGGIDGPDGVALWRARTTSLQPGESMEM